MMVSLHDSLTERLISNSSGKSNLKFSLLLPKRRYSKRLMMIINIFGSLQIVNFLLIFYNFLLSQKGVYHFAQ